MALKRSQTASDLSEEASRPAKKPRKGFTVGPDHLPDGTYRRRARKIKSDLIQKAKIRKKYAKIKEQELGSGSKGRSDHHPRSTLDDQDAHAADESQEQEVSSRGDLVGADPEQDDSNHLKEDDDNTWTGKQDQAELTQQHTTTTPSGKDMNKHEHDSDADHESAEHNGPMHPDRIRVKREKTQTYKKELEQAEKKRVELEAARVAKIQALEERHRKREERERWRKQMAKARIPGKNGQRRLGRESKVLLEKVQKLVGQS